MHDHLTRTVPALLELLQRSDVRELELEEAGVRIRIHRAPAPDGVSELEVDGEEQVVESENSGPFDIVSPLVGTFYRAGQSGAPPLVGEGSCVTYDTVVGIVEALSVLTDVEAGCEGIVSRVLATDGQPVEYGQSLFEVAPGV